MAQQKKDELPKEISTAYEKYKQEHTPETFFALLFACRYYGNEEQRKAVEDIAAHLFYPTMNRDFQFGPTISAIYNLEKACNDAPGGNTR